MTATANPNIAHLFLDRHLEDGLGDRIALRTDQGNWSYRQVVDLSLHYASQLRELGVRREDRVLISLPDGADWVATFFGILRLGAVVVMGNPNLPAQALAGLASYTRAKVVVGDESRCCVQTVATLKERYDALDLPPPRTFTPQAPAATTAAPALHCVRVDPAESAIWLFSGGTTGTPKAVMQSHASFEFTTKAYAQGVLGLTREDVTISVPKLYFGYATGSNLLFPFSVGASCVLHQAPCRAADLASWIQTHKATVLIHVPTMVAKMLADPSIEPEQLSSLRLATSAGEALPASVHEKWNARFGIDLLDGLGTAEMWHIFLSNIPGQARPGSLGKPVPGFEISLRTEDGQQSVEPGQPGWLWVRGGALAIGYWLRPDKDQEAFHGEWYRSGDLLRQDEDGYFYYCGRSGDLMKVSGKWLAPADVENVLLTHPAVASAVVVGAEDASGLQKPYAFVTLTAQGLASFDETQLRQFVADQLEPYKSPRAVFVAKGWPKTHLGKADRAKLRAMVAPLREGQVKFDAHTDAGDFRLTEATPAT